MHDTSTVIPYVPTSFGWKKQDKSKSNKVNKAKAIEIEI